MRYTVKVTRNGQITIPKEFRDQLNLKIGSELTMKLDEGDTIIQMEKLPDMQSWSELLRDVPILFPEKSHKGDDSHGE